MKLLPLLFLFLVSCHKTDYIFELVSEYDKDNAERITFCIEYYSFMYDLDSGIVARLIEQETHFNRFKISSVGARGIGQIRPEVWSHLLYRIDSGNLGRHIREKNITNTARYYHRFGYGIEMTCIILKHYLDKYKSYELALLYYHMSRNSQYFWDLRKGRRPIMSCRYISNVMTED